MLEMPESYEQAVVLTDKSTSCELNRRYLNSVRWKAGIIAAAAIVAGIVIGLVTKDRTFACVTTLCGLLLSITFLFPLFGRKRVMKEIRNGTFFLRHSRTEITSYAEMFVLENNAFERTGKIQKVKKSKQLEYPETYEQAVELSKYSTLCEINYRFLRSVRRKAWIIAAVVIVGGIATGLITGDNILAYGIIPNGLLISFSSLFPLFGRKRVMTRIRNGTFFARHSRGEVMSYAEAFVLENNAFERTGKLQAVDKDEYD